MGAVEPSATSSEDAVAVAVSARSGGVTLIVTVAVGLVCEPSLTTSEKASVVGLAGAVNVGCAAVADDSVTAGPLVWVH